MEFLIGVGVFFLALLLMFGGYFIVREMVKP